MAPISYLINDMWQICARQLMFSHYSKYIHIYLRAIIIIFIKLIGQVASALMKALK